MSLVDLTISDYKYHENIFAPHHVVLLVWVLLLIITFFAFRKGGTILYRAIHKPKRPRDRSPALCKYPPTDDILLEDFNAERERHHGWMQFFEEGTFKILCDKCFRPLVPQEHIDTSFELAPKRLMICSNILCQHRGYKYL